MDNYEKFNGKMILRDYLALDRTKLANERTFLSYLRLFIGIFSAGVAMVQLTEIAWVNLCGYFFVFIAPAIVIIGSIRYYKICKKLKIFKIL